MMELCKSKEITGRAFRSLGVGLRKGERYGTAYLVVYSGFVLCWAGNVRATIVELPLDCAGTYCIGYSWEADFDLGVEFTDISSVSIEWSGEITGGRSVYTSNPNDPLPKFS